MSLNTSNPDLEFSALTSSDELEVQTIDLKGAVLVTPADAPLPNELTELAATGRLYERLRPLAVDSDTITVVQLSGPELLSLAPVWRALTAAPKVYVLTGLPGARYDVTFNSAMRQIGLRSVDWADVTDTMARAKALAQSRADAQPWTHGAGDDTAAADPMPRERPRGPRPTKAVNRVDPKIALRLADDEEGIV